MYHTGARKLQAQFHTQALADRLEQVTVHNAFTAEDRAFIENASMFFLATADAEGQPDCSYKGGLPGFVRVTDDHTLVFPDYDGNGMFRSLGNILVNPKVGLLFVDFEQGDRMRVNGTADIRHEDPIMADFPGAKSMVFVRAEQIFPNCPRYIHKMKLVEHSVYAPRKDHIPPVPGWKKNPSFKDVVPPT